MRLSISNLAFIGGVLGLFLPIHAYSATATEVVAALSNTDWHERDKAVAQVRGALAAEPSVRAATLALLERENEQRDQWHRDQQAGKNPPSSGEGYGEYYINLVAQVIAFKESKSAKALVGALDTGAAPEKALTEMGDAAAQEAIAAFDKAANSQRRAAIVRVLGRMADKGLSSASLREKAKNVVFRGADDASSDVRKAAIHNLDRFSKQEAIEKLKKIAASDSDSFVHKKQNKRKYPLREEAQAELDRLSKSK